MTERIILQNEQLQIGLLPETGASIAFLRYRHHDQWYDILRPTPPDQDHNPRAASSFLMIPWTNRIRDGRFNFDGVDYQLSVESDDGTARHGDVRKRPWTIVPTADAHTATMHFISGDAANINFPFAFTASQKVSLQGNQVTITLTLTNTDTRRMPCGVGHHPYFLNPANDPLLLEVPCSHYWQLDTRLMPTGIIEEVSPLLDFRTLRAVDNPYNHILTRLNALKPTRLVYPRTGITVHMTTDKTFGQMLVFTPDDSQSVAVEPMTLVTDGYNLALAAHDTGLWILEAGESRTATITLQAFSEAS